MYLIIAMDIMATTGMATAGDTTVTDTAGTTVIDPSRGTTNGPVFGIVTTRVHRNSHLARITGAGTDALHKDSHAETA